MKRKEVRIDYAYLMWSAQEKCDDSLNLTSPTLERADSKLLNYAAGRNASV